MINNPSTLINVGR